MSNLYQEIYLVVNLIPEGKVATYGQIARLIGKPRHARHVGFALAALPDDNNVPWHRVVNAQGKISTRKYLDYENYQRVLLEEEGLEFGIGDRLNLKQYQWRE